MRDILDHGLDGKPLELDSAWIMKDRKEVDIKEVQTSPKVSPMPISQGQDPIEDMNMNEGTFTVGHTSHTESNHLGAVDEGVPMDF